MAYRSLEEVAAYISRTYAPARDVTGQPTDFHSKQYLTGKINAERALVSAAHQRNGYWGGVDWYGDGGAETRGWAWSSMILAGWYSIADELHRGFLDGTATSGSAGGLSVMASIWDFINGTATQAGLFSRTKGGTSPDVYDFSDPTSPSQVRFEFPSPTARRGAFPFAPEFPDEQATNQLHFHQMFVLKSIAAWKRNVWAPGDVRYAQLDRVLRYHDYYTQGARTYTQMDGHALVPYGLASTFNNAPVLTNLTEPPSLAITLADTLAGQAAQNGGSFWQFFARSLISQNPDVYEVSLNEYGYDNHNHKCAGNAYFAARGLDEPDLLQLANAVYAQNGLSPAELFAYVFRGPGANVQNELTSTSSGKRYQNYGEWTFAASLLAHLLNLHT